MYFMRDPLLTVIKHWCMRTFTSCNEKGLNPIQELDAAKSTDEEKKAAGDAEGVAENDLQ